MLPKLDITDAGIIIDIELDMDPTRKTPRSRDVFDGYNVRLPDEDIEATLPSASAMYHESVESAASKMSDVNFGEASGSVPRKPLPRSIDILDAYKPVPTPPPSTVNSRPSHRPFPLGFGNTTTCTHDDDDVDFATMMRNSSVRKPQPNLQQQQQQQSAQQAEKESGWAAVDKRAFWITLACATVFTAVLLVVILAVGYSNRGPFRLDRPYNAHGP